VATSTSDELPLAACHIAFSRRAISELQSFFDTANLRSQVAIRYVELSYFERIVEQSTASPPKTTFNINRLDCGACTDELQLKSATDINSDLKVVVSAPFVLGANEIAKVDYVAPDFLIYIV
jgi:hypothetical protein